MATRATARIPPSAGEKPKLITATESVTLSAERTRPSNDKSPKSVELKSPCPANEKKRPSKLTELEMQLSQELKKTKEQLSASESLKLQAEQEAEVSKKRLDNLAGNLDDSQNQILGLLTSKEAHLQELRKISQERDQSRASELEAFQKQRLLDLAALSSAFNETQTLKFQLEANAEEEVARAREIEMAHTELVAAKHEMSDMLSLVKDVNMLLQDCKKSECQSPSLVKEALLQLEAAKRTVDLLQSDKLQALESFEAVSKELYESQTYGRSLEQVIIQLKNDLAVAKDVKEVAELPHLSGESNKKKSAVHLLKREISQLEVALKEMELKYQEKTQATLEIQTACDIAKAEKSDSNQRESELKAELNMVREDIGDRKTRQMVKEIKVQCVTAEIQWLHEQIGKWRRINTIMNWRKQKQSWLK